MNFLKTNSLNITNYMYKFVLGYINDTVSYEQIRINGQQNGHPLVEINIPVYDNKESIPVVAEAEFDAFTGMLSRIHNISFDGKQIEEIDIIKSIGLPEEKELMVISALENADLMNGIKSGTDELYQGNLWEFLKKQEPDLTFCPTSLALSLQTPESDEFTECYGYRMHQTPITFGITQAEMITAASQSR